jgi:TMEM199 family protein
MAILVAVVVAFSEIVLYIIWQDRRSKPSTKRLRTHLSAKHKKDDSGDDEVKSEDTKAERRETALRQRTVMGERA